MIRLVVPAALINLSLQPLLVFWPTLWLNLPDLWKKVLVLEAAMPSATLSAVFAQRYGCEAGLVSLLIFSTVVLSFLTIMGVLGVVVRLASNIIRPFVYLNFCAGDRHHA